jgi:hypothetical protein
LAHPGETTTDAEGLARVAFPSLLRYREVGILRRWIWGAERVAYFGEIRMIHPDYEAYRAKLGGLTGSREYHQESLPPAITILLVRKSRAD